MTTDSLEVRLNLLKQSWSEVIELVDQVVELRPKLRELMDAHDEIKHQMRIQLCPTVVEDIQEYIDFRLHSETLKIDEARIKSRIDGLNKQIKSITLKVRQVIPSEVWFRHGDLAFGVSYSDWGGSNYRLEIVKWGDKLPSLDRRYRGD